MRFVLYLCVLAAPLWLNVNKTTPHTSNKNLTIHLFICFHSGTKPTETVSTVINNRTDSGSTTRPLWSLTNTSKQFSEHMCELWVFRVRFNSANTTVRVLFISSRRGNREVQSALHTQILACGEKT